MLLQRNHFQLVMVWPLDEFQGPSQFHGLGPQSYKCKVVLTSLKLGHKNQMFGSQLESAVLTNVYIGDKGSRPPLLKFSPWLKNE